MIVVPFLGSTSQNIPDILIPNTFSCQWPSKAKNTDSTKSRIAIFARDKKDERGRERPLTLITFHPLATPPHLST
jgi:hypothetical protein